MFFQVVARSPQLKEDLLYTIRPHHETSFRQSSTSTNRMEESIRVVRNATCNATANICLERRNSIKPGVRPRKERRRKPETTVYLPALGNGPRPLVVGSEYTNVRNRRHSKRA